MSEGTRASDSGKSLLHQAVTAGDLARVKALLSEIGANTKDEEGRSPLEIAVKLGHVPIAEVLIQGGADLRHQTQDGVPLVVLAAEKGDADMLSLFAKKDADFTVAASGGSNALHRASANGHLSCLGILIRKGLQVNATDAAGLTALHLACKNDHEACARMLISKGANVNAVAEGDLTPLHVAAVLGHAECVAALIDSKADVNLKATIAACLPMSQVRLPIELGSRSGETFEPIHCAALSGSSAVVKKVVEAGANVNATTQANITPLMLACASGRAEAVSLLLQSGAEAQKRDCEQNTPLHYASITGVPEIVELLHSKGVSVVATNADEATALHLAAKAGNLPFTKQLLVHTQAHDGALSLRDKEGFAAIHYAAAGESSRMVKALLSAGSNIQWKDLEGNSPLHLAAEQGQKKCIKALISRKGLIDAVNDAGSSSLHTAALNGKSDCVEYLLRMGANKDLQDEQGLTPLMAACKEGHISSARYLVQAGCDIQKRDKTGASSLHHACLGGHYEVAKWLIKKGVPVDILDSQKGTPLQNACCKGAARLANMLIKRGANVRAEDCDVLSPIHHAASNGSVRCVNVLLKNAADVNARTHTGATALLLASAAAQTQVIEALVSSGADVNISDENGTTPLHHAAALGLLSTVKLLLQKGARVKMTKEGSSPIQAAALSGAHACFELLLSTVESPDSLSDVNGVTLLHTVCNAGLLEPARSLLSKYPSLLNRQDNTGTTPLHYAARSAKTPLVVFLLEQGADAEISDSRGWTALTEAVNAPSDSCIRALLPKVSLRVDKVGRHLLHIAANTGQPAALEALLEQPDCVVDVRDKEGRTPLIVAIQTEHMAVALQLKLAGADINAADGTGQTAGEMARNKNYFALVTLEQNSTNRVSQRNSPQRLARQNSRVKASSLLSAQREKERMEVVKQMLPPVSATQDVLALIQILSDPSLSLLHAIFATTQITEADSIAKALVMTFSFLEEGLSLIRSAINFEVENTQTVNTLFRGNSIVSKMLYTYAMDTAKEYLYDTLKEPIEKIVKNPTGMEVDPAKLSSGDKTQSNFPRLISAADSIFQAIVNSTSSTPDTIRELCQYLREDVQEKFPSANPTLAVAGFVFLRFFTPAVVTPEAKAGILDPEEVSSEARRPLLLISKMLQHVANRTEFKDREAFMSPANQWIKDRTPKLEEFLRDLSAPFESSSQRDPLVTPKELCGYLNQLYRHVITDQKRIVPWVQQNADEAALQQLRKFLEGREASKPLLDSAQISAASATTNPRASVKLATSMGRATVRAFRRSSQVQM